MQELDNKAISYLAQAIREKVFKAVNNNRATVFLCGAAIRDKNCLRGKLGEYLASDANKYSIQLLYPEDIFEELLFSSKGNLLTLEGLLAESVDWIVIIPESPGSFAELGAFANDEKLRSKIICLVDSKFRKDKSFINQGPLRLVKSAGKPGVLYFDRTSPIDTFKQLQKILVKRRKQTTKNGSLTLLQLEGFLVPSIYLLEPVSKKGLVGLVKEAIEQNSMAELATTAVLSELIKKRKIELTGIGFKLTKFGVREFLDTTENPYSKKRVVETLEIDNLRSQILNYRYRKKALKK